MAPGRLVTPDRARVALGIIRLTNGSLALVVPSIVGDRLGLTGGQSAAGSYLLRMFGIRTVYLGLDLLSADERRRGEALRRAPVIHASDAVAALLAGISRQLPLRAAVPAFGISCLNLALALAARPAPD